MIYFCIPLISKQASKDWETVTMLFNRTLWSVYNQTCPKFKVIIACHDIPKLDKKYDDRVEFIKVNSPIPKSHEEKMVDKGYKTHTLAMRVRELGGGYAMLVDADDLVSCRIAEFIENNPNENGYFVKTGYVYFVGDNYMKKLRKFSSGTACIINYSIDDLPSNYPKVMTDNNNNNECLMRKRHGGVVDACAKLGRELKPLPFLGAVYVLGSGENHSLYRKNTKYQTRLREFIQKLEPRYKIKGNLKKEFSIDWV